MLKSKKANSADDTVKKASALFFGLLALALAIWGIKQLLPERNVFGNPELEKLVTQCQIPAAQLTVRLYEGNGDATVANWYSVTLEGGNFSREQQFFYTYGWPSIKSIECRSTEVVIIAEDKRFNLTLKQIKHELIHHPMGFYKGQPQESFVQPLRILVIIWGLLLELISAGIVWKSIKLFRTS